MNFSKNRFLSITELSENINLPITTLRFFVFKKEIPYLKIGKRLMFDLNEIEIWLESKKRGYNGSIK